VLDTIFNDWLLRKFRGNLRRMDRANSLDLMLRDLEQLAAGDPPAPAASSPLAA
jgi:UDP-N-acetylglucosamine--N-acetylmuramyl-(pentapeptide) pyrophosphoryl-undecaprenol N-acetylglucosamine transferase